MLKEEVEQLYVEDVKDYWTTGQLFLYSLRMFDLYSPVILWGRWQHAVGYRATTTNRNGYSQCR